ncbi:ABC transporter ATP-binding protein [Antarcticirhabdus aurantiaca]|uniref:ABC transporter ATP-binding protein n=1 Tax=Antarcticirhabdus aurantiaca TaxID=2606717 RepID=A0ACD4NRG2_9HYPH|nr:ABC transporter ATP-binding protein [Antarcticirhabdus aurantiaca]WAJ29282.1 ABC transporter ATP-binding protein [Jeongeuplla avenae]
MIRVENLTKRYGDSPPVVDDLSMEVAAGEICAVVGTSGSGKTTLLRMINRLVEPSAGRVLIAGENTRGLRGHELRRRIGYVIQGHGLFPHWSVAQNIGTVPRLLGWKPAEIKARVDELLGLFGMEPAAFRDRRPAELSGGQQQRVGVARALAARPDLLLMDEPFGALDPVIRGRAQDELAAVQARLGTTIMLVTHDMEEAVRLGHRIAVMDGGRLLQCASPAEMMARPATPFVEALVGGAERPFRLLSLERVEAAVEAGEADGPPIDAEASLRDALSACLWSGRDALPVEREGRRIGRVTLAALRHRAAPGGAGRAA